MIIRPAIDVLEGQVVRLTEGRFETRQVYAHDPLEVARQVEDAGLTHLHLVDLDGAKAGHPKQLFILEKLAQHTRLKIDVGGGIKTTQDVLNAFDAGAAQVNIGSAAVKTPDEVLEWLDEFGPERLILCADARDGHVATHGWQRTTAYPVVEFVGYYLQKGIQQVMVTDVRRDGTLLGPSTELYASLLQAHPGLNLIASGGVRHRPDVEQLQAMGIADVVIGKAWYEGKISLADLHHLASQAPSSH